MQMVLSPNRIGSTSLDMLENRKSTIRKSVPCIMEIPYSSVGLQKLDPFEKLYSHSRVAKVEELVQLWRGKIPPSIMYDFENYVMDSFYPVRTLDRYLLAYGVNWCAMIRYFSEFETTLTERQREICEEMKSRLVYYGCVKLLTINMPTEFHVTKVNLKEPAQDVSKLQSIVRQKALLVR